MMEEDMVLVERPPPYTDQQLPITATEHSARAVGRASEATTPPSRPVLTQDDIVIVVMGVTGAGKSTFVSLLSADKDIEIGHDLKSKTKHVSVHGFRMTDGRQGWLFDTPGFDDTSRSDTEILREISSTLAGVYTREASIAAVLYLHRITDPRMGYSAIRNLEMFKLLCGKEAMKGVALVTTRWAGMDAGSPQWETAVERERQLAHSEKYWAGMLRDGAEIRRHTGSRDSASDIVESLVQRQFKTPLAIQTELAKQSLPLDQTGVGRYLAKEQEDLQARYEQEMKELEAEKTEAMQEKNRELADELAVQEQKYRAQYAESARSRHNLHVDYHQLSEENAQKLALTSGGGGGGGGSDEQKPRGAHGEPGQQMKAQMELLAQNVAELQDDMERQDREHKEQIARLRKQAQNRDKQHQIETSRLIEQMEARHVDGRRQMNRRMETLRKSRPRRRSDAGYRDEEEEVGTSLTRVLRWLAGGEPSRR